ncbi:MAG: methionine--tRNA ligase [Alphaproteobacteria bacterium]|nr:methionine--tRNA ligase [Alphaproteobacteria bacterium]
MAERFYITTPIYYVNDVPHIGHAYTTLACDVMARFMRLEGREVMFLTGTDEHGQKVEKAAAAAGDKPQVFVDRVSQNFRTLAARMKYTNDDFIRTTEPRHIKASQALWKAIAASGNIYLGSYEGWYSVRDEAFFAEDELVPGPGGKKRAPTGADVEWVKEPSYFFKLSAWQDRLLAFYEQNPGAVQPDSRRNEVVSFVAGGLRDLSISRTSFKWGIPVPDAPGHIMYVWLDALTNYLTAIGYPDTGSAMFQRYWPADVHVVGKDILRFHAVYWPAFLMAAGLEPPRRVFAHGWWTVEGEKMSKSLGNVVDPHAMVDRYGLDPVRYFLLREVPFGNDGDFSQAAMVHRINGDLANDLGNLAQRSLSMIQSYFAGVLPKPAHFSDSDRLLIEQAGMLHQSVAAAVERQALHDALAEVWKVVGDANRYVDSEKPWSVRKTDPVRAGTVLYVLAETVRNIAMLLQAFLPDSAARMLEQLGVPAAQRSLAQLGVRGQLVSGVQLPKPEPVFPRYVAEEKGAA